MRYASSFSVDQKKIHPFMRDYLARSAPPARVVHTEESEKKNIRFYNKRNKENYFRVINGD